MKIASGIAQQQPKKFIISDIIRNCSHFNINSGYITHCNVATQSLVSGSENLWDMKRCNAMYQFSFLSQVFNILTLTIEWHGNGRKLEKNRPDCRRYNYVMKPPYSSAGFIPLPANQTATWNDEQDKNFLSAIEANTFRNEQLNKWNNSANK